MTPEERHQLMNAFNLPAELSEGEKYVANKLLHWLNTHETSKEKLPSYILEHGPIVLRDYQILLRAFAILRCCGGNLLPLRGNQWLGVWNRELDLFVKESICKSKEPVLSYR